MALVLALIAPAAPASADYTSGQVVHTGYRAIGDNITVTGNQTALSVMNAGATARMDGRSITINSGGMLYYGAQAALSGTIILTDVTVRTAGAGFNHGLFAQDNGTITMTGGSITTNAIGSNGAYASSNGNINLENVAVTAAGVGSYALQADSGGRLTARVDGQSIYGAGGLAVAAAGGVVELTAGGSSRLTGISGVTAGGTVTLARPAALPLQLYILDALGGPGGTLKTSVNINDANLSDRITVAGTATGNHRIEATVLGGYPADLYQVVRVVELNNALANTATFNGGSDVRAYRYGVAKGSALPAAYGGVFTGYEEDFYLYNTFTPSSPASAAIGTAAADSVIWYGELNELRKRLGDLRQGAGGDNFWTRTYAAKFRVTPGAGQDFTQQLYGLELGRDARADFSGGKRHTGWVAGGGWADRAFGHGGSGRTDSAHLGAYSSLLRDDGTYWDVVVKHNWYHHRFDTPLLGGGYDSAAFNTSGVGLSVETGRRIEKGGGYFVEPQAELAALWTRGGNYATAGGLAVSAQAETSLQLRAGGIAGRKTALAGGGSRQFYCKLAWVQELAGDNRTTVDGVSFASSLKGGRAVAGIGYSEDKAGRHLYLDVETAWGAKADIPWSVNLGGRWRF